MNAGNADLGAFSIALRRQIQTIAYIVGPVLAIFIGIALGLPDIYRSTGVIRITDSVDRNSRAVDSYAEYYVETLAGQVLTSANLENWIEELDLFAGESNWTVLEKKAELRKNLKTTIVTTPVIDPINGREREVVTGFEVTARSASPDEAERVASAAVEAFLAENRRSRQARGQNEIDFFKEEADVYRTQIAEVEARLAEFKERNSRRLPELMEVNMTSMDRVERDLEAIELQKDNLKRERVFLQSQLNQIPSSSNEVIEQLAALQKEYVRISSVYQDTHPDVISIRKQIDLLSQTVDSAAAIPILQQQLDDIAVALTEAKEKYSDAHPEVRRLARSESALRERIAMLAVRSGVDDGSVESTNDLYVQLNTQIKAIDIQIAGINARSQELRQKRNEYEELLFQTPQVEREYQELSRDLANARKLYEETQEKQRQAELSLALERSATGERLVLAQEPTVPRLPVWPPRVPIVILGLILALSMGVGFATMREITSSTVRGSRDAFEICGTPPIALIPPIYNSAKRLAKGLQNITFLVCTVVVGAIAFFGANTY